jgi:hypothetical protein
MRGFPKSTWTIDIGTEYDCKRDCGIPDVQAIRNAFAVVTGGKNKKDWYTFPGE